MASWSDTFSSQLSTYLSLGKMGITPAHNAETQDDVVIDTSLP